MDGSASFATQPYQQLANVYLAAGRDADARKVAIARRRDLRAFGNLSRPGWLGNWLLDNTIRYGYRTWRAAVGLVIVYAIVVAVFWCARFHGGVIPVQTTPNVTSTEQVTAASCNNRDYPCFNPFGYAINTVIPIINVHQADFWSPNGLGPVVVTYLGTAFGWLFVTLAVAGYTGLARNTANP